MMGHSPNDFWNSSHSEVVNAVTGFSEFNGGNDKETPMTSDRMNELMELYPD